MIGPTLSHYKILDEVSRGGMGIVYRALDLKLNREVALKVLPPDPVSNRSASAASSRRLRRRPRSSTPTSRSFTKSTRPKG
jgi:serine/threonine protein kinase